MIKAMKEKKNNRKMRKQVRKTLGALFLISAIIVAAIPLEGVKAVSAGLLESLTWDKDINDQGKSTVPIVKMDEKEIYTTGDGMFQFAYVKAKDTDTNKIAVILGYNGTNLVNNTLTIPSTMDAFTKYTETQGTTGGYVAVGRDGNPLFYKVEKTEILDGVEIVVDTEYFPCYYADKAKWEELNSDEMYYLDDTDTYQLTEDETKQWIKNVSVAYIGNQILVANTNPNSNQEWVVSSGAANTDPAEGIFANEGNIKTLIVGDNLLGIGNYAFYGCASLKSITLGNGLTEIGKSAFENCINMTNVSLDTSSKIQYLSDRTFYNCKALSHFAVPISVSRIFDSAFEASGLETIELCGYDQNVMLSELGYYVFKDCEKLTKLVFPESLKDSEVHINNVMGCESLASILVPNKEMSFKEDSTSTTVDPYSYTIEDFKNCVSDKFYFEGLDISAIHSLASEHAIAFKYLEQDIYEKIISDGTSRLTYRVNSKNELIMFNLEGTVETVTIPAQIGPYYIEAINQGSFSHNCDLKKIIIPSTVIKINDSAFIGCHNLKNVVFEDADTIEFIGENSFATQRAYVDANNTCSKCGDTLEHVPVLTFTGTISEATVPFQYAMSPNSNINYGTQVKTYITYYSGWPTNLEVSYNEETGLSELKDIPHFADLSNYNDSSYPYMTQELADAAKTAYANYKAGNELTENEQDIINSALNIEIPTGIESFKEGMFSGKALDENGVLTSVPGENANNEIQSIVFDSILEFPAYSITGCDALESITINGGAEKIDDYAFAIDVTEGSTDTPNLKSFTMTAGGKELGDYVFDHQSNLDEVVLSSTVETVGLRPFSNCPSVQEVDFSGGPYFICDKGIIFGLNDGAKDTIVQVLEARGKDFESSTIMAEELNGVTSMYEEAFMNAAGVGSVDLSKTTIKDVPANAFFKAKTLGRVILPYGCESITENAFKETMLTFIEIPNTVAYIDPDAFNTNNNSPVGEYQNLTFYCEEGSPAYIYAGKNDNINVSDKPPEVYFTVYFWDYDKAVLKEELVPMGGNATAPEVPEREGYTFTGWSMDFTKVSRDLDVVAQYEKIDSEDTKFTVNFYDKDDKLILTQKVASGEDAISPALEPVEGYKFIGWRPGITEVTKDIDTYAQYEKSSESGDNSGDGSDDGSDDNGTTNSKLYTVTVKNGSGSGSYVEGATVVISANQPSSTQKFDKWTTDSAKASLTSATSEATTFKMPAENVTVTATYKTVSTSTGGDSNNGSSGNGGSGSGSGSGSGDDDDKVTSGNNTVIIDKNGLSNTDKVSITVNGSSDNFTLVIEEDADATEEILRALIAEYGSLDNIKYFPMDITLYDSTGKIKVKDTTGLSIDITLPIPDSLIKYAGNNKTAAVNNEKLEKLTPRFSTIDGVKCITFTAEHFSPYVIYVDTTNLAITDDVVDEVPKTGDGIHPKWFIAIGLACMSLVFFTKKDKIQSNLNMKKA